MHDLSDASLSAPSLASQSSSPSVLLSTPTFFLHHFVLQSGSRKIGRYAVGMHGIRNTAVSEGRLRRNPLKYRYREIAKFFFSGHIGLDRAVSFSFEHKLNLNTKFQFKSTLGLTLVWNRVLMMDCSDQLDWKLKFGLMCRVKFSIRDNVYPALKENSVK